MAYWLLKSEPETFGIDHLREKGVEHWDGVRNYAARNNLMAMKLGDLGFFYHSSCEVPGVVGICEVVREHYPDFTQFDPASKYFDARIPPDKPRWFMPDVAFVSKFDHVVPLAEIRHTPGLTEMEMFRFNRLSVSGVSETEWRIICEMAGSPLDPRQQIASAAVELSDEAPRVEAAIETAPMEATSEAAP
jgi:predicted RNA-binding protein with PUA-like domain